MYRTTVWAACLLTALPAAMPSAARADAVMDDRAVRGLDLQTYWQTRLPFESGEHAVRVVSLDDAVYVVSSRGRAYAVHAATGVLRWSKEIAEPGQLVRGPSHNEQYVFFTAAGSVRVLDRRSGDLAGMPRKLRGVVVEVSRDIASINMGEDHGVRLDDVLNVYRLDEAGEIQGAPVARLRVFSLKPRSAMGRLFNFGGLEGVRPGDAVHADVLLPLERVALPFAASSAAVADATHLYVGAANQLVYSIEFLSGTQRWKVMAPKTVSSMPVLLGEALYFGTQDGLVVACTKLERERIWTFQTEGPIFADLVVDGVRVLVASRDRSLYCLDRKTGRRLWRERFDNPLDESPMLHGQRVYQEVPVEGLFVLDAATGRQLWRRAVGGHFLLQLGEEALLFDESWRSLVRVDVADGRERRSAEARRAELFASNTLQESVFLVARDGDVACLRSSSAPRLRPAEVAAVLRNDRRLRIAAEVEAERKAAAPKAAPPEPKKLLSIFYDDDLLSSRSTAKPSGGRGLVETEEAERPPAAGRKEEPKEEETDEAEEEKAEKDEKEDEETASEEEDEEAAEGDEESEETEEMEEDSSATEDDKESSDDEAEDEAGEDEEESEDDKGGSANEKEKDDKGGEGGKKPPKKEPKGG